MMRVYVAVPLTVGQNIVLPPDAAHHVVQVMRRSAGDKIALFNNADGEFLATLHTVHKKQTVVSLDALIKPYQPCLPVSLWFAPLKKDAGDFLVQKVTELGVGQLRPVITQHTTAQRTNIARWQSVVVGAAEQCGLTALPSVHEPMSFAQALPLLGAGGVMFCHERLTGTQHYAANVLKTLNPLPQHIIIGPEGGFSASERDLLQNLPNAHAVSLGERILRAETAAIAALVLWQAVALF